MLRPASLRLRLIIWPAVVLSLTLALTVMVTLKTAPGRIDAEVRSSMELGERFVAIAVAGISASPDPQQALERLAYDLPHLRHVRFAVAPAAEVAGPGYRLAFWRGTSDVPAWFTGLIKPEPIIRGFPIVAGGRTYGSLLILANPLDEIAEIWHDLTFLAGLLVALAVVITAILAWAVDRALRPVRALADGLDELEHGRFDHAIPPIRIAEFSRIGAQFNSLTLRLKRVTEDNHHLIDRLMLLQEAERKELARELHDEFGPCLFGIRAEVACILRGIGSADPRAAEVRERAQSIATIVDSIQKINYRLLASLRPLVLDHIGLVEALRQLVDGWQERHPEMSWSADLPEEDRVDDESVALTLYRIVQECLTNVGRHARAGRVHVIMAHEIGSGERGESRDAPMIRLTVVDDGIGLPTGLRFGFGLLGMGERVRRLGGRLAVGNAPQGGTRVEVLVPIEIPEAMG